MNILILVGVYPGLGGVERITTVLANSLVHAGMGVSVVSFEGHGGESTAALDPRVNLYRIKYPVLRPRNIRTLKEIIRKEDIKVLINQWCLPFYVTMLCRAAIKGSDCKLVSVHHNAPEGNMKISGVKTARDESHNPLTREVLGTGVYAARKATAKSLRYAYRHSDRFVVLSKRYIPQYAEMFGEADQKKLAVIPNPVTQIDYNYRYSPEGKQPEVLCVGRLSHIQKRVDRVLKTWKIFHETHPGWKLTILGNGVELKDLKRMRDKMELRNVSFEGYRDPVEYYKRASIILQTSEFEGFAMVIGEGMSFGVVPVVYGSYDSVHDLIEDGVSGIITPVPFDAGQSAGALAQLADNPALMDSMARAAMEESVNYSIHIVTKKWLDMLGEIASLQTEKPEPQ